jgi:GH25 family lysozyme M1 (1,4-beta-N-acetylmuramidase)
MTEYIQGIDISEAQGPNVDHRLVAESGMKFCICRATQGRNSEDDDFEVNIKRIRSVMADGYEYYPGAYHVARPDSDGGGAADGAAEGEDFCDVVERVCGSILENFLPPVLDFEKYSDSDYVQNIPWIESWISVVERRLNRRPMIYTGKNIWFYEVGNTSRFIDYDLWQTFFSADATQPPAMPWPKWSIWQWSGGKEFQHHPPVPGVGVVDVDRWHGTIGELRLFANFRAQPKMFPSPPPQLELKTLRGSYSLYVARIQSMLLAYGYGPQGLVNSKGFPDGFMGNRTEAYILDFKTKRGLPANTMVDWATWWALAYDGLS